MSRRSIRRLALALVVSAVASGAAALAGVEPGDIVLAVKRLQTQQGAALPGQMAAFGIDAKRRCPPPASPGGVARMR